MTRLFLILAVSVCLQAVARVPLSPELLAQLAAETSEHVTEIARARAIARAARSTLAVYGGLSRELLIFTQRKVDELGSIEAYRQWLSQNGRLHLLNFHRIQSDLDLMLIPDEGGPLSEERKGQLEEVIASIRKQLPGNIFFKDIDIRIQQVFLQDPKFMPSKEHYEAISNIAIGPQGAIHLPELRVQIEGSEKDLTNWGLEQFSNGVLEFRRNPKFSSSMDAYLKTRQLLRWIRYASEHPEMRLSDQSRAEMLGLLSDIRRNHFAEVREMLSSGNLTFRYKNTAESQGEKLIEALEKLQIYSPDSERTAQLLVEFGIEKIAKEAGIDHQRIFKPLPRRQAPSTGKRLGKPLRLKHRTRLSAAQNMSKGGLWISDDRTIIGGKQTVAALGPGIYAAENFDSLSYGDMYLDIVLSADAVEGKDFKKRGDYYVILNRDCIEAIEPISMEKLFGEFERQLAHPEITDEQRQSLIRGLASLLHPDVHDGETELFERVYRKSVLTGTESQFLKEFFSKTGAFEGVMGAAKDSQFKQLLRKLYVESEVVRDSLRSLVSPLAEKNTKWPALDAFVVEGLKSSDPISVLLAGTLFRVRLEALERRREYSAGEITKGSIERWQHGIYKDSHISVPSFVSGQEEEFATRLSALLYFPSEYWRADVNKLMVDGTPFQTAVILQTFASHPAVRFDDALWQLLLQAREKHPEVAERLDLVLMGRMPEWDEVVRNHVRERLAAPNTLSASEIPLALAYVKNVSSGNELPGRELPFLVHLMKDPAFASQREAMRVALTEFAERPMPMVRWFTFSYADMYGYSNSWERGDGEHYDPVADALHKRVEADPKTWRRTEPRAVADLLQTGDPGLILLATRMLQHYRGWGEEIWSELQKAAPLLTYVPHGTQEKDRPALNRYLQYAVRKELELVEHFYGTRMERLPEISNRLKALYEKPFSDEIWDVLGRSLHARQFAQVLIHQRNWSEATFRQIENYIRDTGLYNDIDLLFEQKPADVQIPDSTWRALDKNPQWSLLEEQTNLPPTAWRTIERLLLEKKQEIKRDMRMYRWRYRHKALYEAFNGRVSLSRMLRIVLSKPEIPDHIRQLLGTHFFRNAIPHVTKDDLNERKQSHDADKSLRPIDEIYKEKITSGWKNDCLRFWQKLRKKIGP